MPPVETTARDDTLAKLEAAYTRANPASQAAISDAARSLPGGNTRTSLYNAPFPLVMERGDGARLFDLDGHRYINFLSEFTSGVYGHSHPVIREAIIEALDTGLSLSAHTLGEARLAAAIRTRYACFETLRFTNSGTEANLMALIAARGHTGRNRIVAFEGGYHGGPLTFAPGAERSNVPFDVLIGTYNDLDQTLARIEPHAPDIAAVIVEPVLGAGGCIPGTTAFLGGLRDWCTENGALLIFDEVQTARHFAAGMQPRLGLQADLTTMGKFLGGGLPIGVYGGRADIMAQFDPGAGTGLSHSGTFNNNALTMRAGLAALTGVYTSDVAERLTMRGEALRDSMNQIFIETGATLRASGIGSIMNLHGLDTVPGSYAQVAQQDSRLRAIVFFALLERGLFTARRGLVALNIMHEDRHLEDFLAALRDIVETHRDALCAQVVSS